MKKIYSCSQNLKRKKILKQQVLWTLILSAVMVFGCNASFAQAWNLLGSAGFSVGGAADNAIAINSSGVPYVAYVDNGIGKVSVKKYDGSSWVTVGSAGISAGGAAYTSIAIDGSGNLYVAYLDAVNGYKATVMKYTGTSWVTVGGAGASSGMAYCISLAIDNSGVPYIAYTDNDYSWRATVKKFNGSSWVNVGSAGFSAGATRYVSLAIDGSGMPYVAYQDDANDSKATVMKYNGSAWATVGTAGFSGDEANYTSLAFDSSGVPYVAYEDAYNHYRATVKKYNGSSWVDVGWDGFSTLDAEGISLAIKGNTPYVAFNNFVYAHKVIVMKYSGGSWSNVGGSGFSFGLGEYPALALDAAGNPYVVYKDEANGDKATVQKFIPTAPPPVTGTATVCVAGTSTLSNTESGGTWSSSNGAVASVGSSSGIVSGMTIGTSIISYSNSSGAATIIVSVQAAPVAGTITGAASVCAGKTIVLSASGVGGTWSSASTGIAVVSSGNVTGVAAGAVVISYTVSNGCGAVAATKSVTVDGSPSAISGASVVSVGNTISLSNVSSGGIWNSDNPFVATVDTSSGIVTGVFNGTVVLSYTISSGCSVTKTITVNDSSVPSPIISRFAGEVTAGYNGDGFPATWAQLYNPAQITGDTAGNIYFAEVYNSRIRKVSASGIISTIAGNGIFAYTGDGGPATASILSYPQGMATDVSGNIYIGDTWNHRVRKISTSGIITTVVGTGIGGYNGDGIAAVSAKIWHPTYIHVDASGNLFICDNSGARIRKVNPAGIISSIAGTGTFGYSGDGGPATAAQIGYAGGVWSDNAGNVYIADATNHRVRMVNSAGTIVTVAGNGVAGSTGDGGPATAARLNQPQGVYGDAANNIYVAEVNGNRIRKISPTGIISTIAGTGIAGFSGDGGPATAAQMAGTNCVYISPSGSMYISEGTGHRIRKIDLSTPITGTPSVCVGATATLSNSSAAGTWSSSNAAVGSVDASSGVVTGLASGTATISYSYPGGLATRIITVKTTPTVDAIGGITSFCAGAGTTLTDITPGGIWTSAGTGIAIVGSTNGVVTGISFGTTQISYTVDNGCGTVAASTTVTVNAPPNVASITGTASVCSGNATTLINATPGGTWTSSATGIATVDGGGIITAITAGTARISYAVSNSCGTTIMTKIVTVNPLPNAGSVMGTSMVCTGTSITLTNGISGGVWTSDATTVATVDSSGVVAGIAVGGATISYTVINSCGTSTATRGLTVNGIPTASAITGASVLPAGSAILFNASPLGGDWISSSDSIATVSSTGNVTGVGVGIAVISYSIANSCGIDVSTKAISVVSAIGGDTLSICAGTIRTLSGMPSGGTWSSSNVSRATISAAGVVTGLVAGTVVISYSVSGSVATVVVTVNTSPAIVGTASVCVGTTATLTSSGGGTWSSAVSEIAAVGSTGIVIGNTAGTAIIEYTLSNGCKATKIATVSAFPDVISGPTSVCVGATMTLVNSVAGGSWSSSSSSLATVGTAGNVTGVAVGTPVITYSIGTCRVTQTVNVLASPATIGGTAKVCPGTTATLTDATVGGVWSSSDPGIGTVSAAGAVTGVVAGTVNVIYTMPNGCSRSAVATINPNPAEITGSVSLCAGATTSLSSATAGLSWSSSDVSKATVNSVSGVVTGVAAGTSTITYKNTTTGCVTTTVVAVSATPASIAGTAKVCPGATTSLSNTTVGGTWSSIDPARATVDATSGVVTGVVAGTATIVYTIGGGCSRSVVVTINATPTLSGTLAVCVGKTTILTSSPAASSWSSSNTGVATVAYGTVTGVASGVADITVTAVTGCKAVANVTVNNLPPAISGTLATCVGSTTSLSNAMPGGTWSSYAPSFASINSTSGVVTGLVASNVMITYTLGSGCIRIGALTVNAAPTINGAPTMCEGASATLSVFIGVGGTWSSGDVLHAIVGSTGVVTGVLAGTATITYTSPIGCQASRVVSVNVCGSRQAITGVGTTELNTQISMFPNPTNGILIVQTPEAGTLSVLAVDGKEVASYSIKEGDTSIVLPKDLAAGVYMCRFIENEGSSAMLRLIYHP